MEDYGVFSPWVGRRQRRHSVRLVLHLALTKVAWVGMGLSNWRMGADT